MVCHTKCSACKNKQALYYTAIKVVYCPFCGLRTTKKVVK